jgi:hypothetical protein
MVRTPIHRRVHDASTRDSRDRSRFRGEKTFGRARFVTSMILCALVMYGIIGEEL